MQRGEPITAPCEYCGASITRTKSAHGSRAHWVCNHSCSIRLQIKLGNGPRRADPNYTGRKETRPCASCGKPVTRLLSQRKADAVWTCSNVCHGKIIGARKVATGEIAKVRKPRRGKSVACEICGTPVYRSLGQTGKRYCSDACRVVASTKPHQHKPCAACGRDMELRPSEAVYKYCSRECHDDAREKARLERASQERAPRVDRQGYRVVWAPKPTKRYPDRYGWVAEHRLVAAATYGPIPKGFHVHHRNGNKLDNDPTNLEILSGVYHAVVTRRDYHQSIKEDREKLAQVLAENEALRLEIEELRKNRP